MSLQIITTVEHTALIPAVTSPNPEPFDTVVSFSRSKKMKNYRKMGTTCISVLLSLLSLTVLFMHSAPAMAANNQYNLACNACHGMPPLDSTQRDVATGAFQGNHQTHVAPAATAVNCVKCHNNSGYGSGHYNGVINMAARINNYSAVSVGAARYDKAVFFNQTSRPTLSTCSNVNCHFETRTPVWSSAMPQTPGDCNLCHTYPPSVGVSGVSHTKHYANVAAWGGLFGPLACTPCHSDGGVNGQAKWTYDHATSAGKRPVHFDGTLGYTGAATNIFPSQAASRVFGSCSNTYCHSNGVQGVGNVKVASPVWGAKTTCGSCHASPMVSNGHSFHLAATYNYGCELCHASTVTNSTTISNVSLHTNNIVEVGFGGIAGSGSGVASCGATYCHTGSTVTPVWNNQASVSCGSCHKADNATLTSNAHPVHLNSASVAYGPTYLQGLAGGSAATSCKVCHTVYPANHANNVKDVSLASCGAGIAGNNCHGNTILTVANWKTARSAITCEGCHTGPALSVIPTGAGTYVTAPDETLSQSKGHTAPTNSLGGVTTGSPVCTTCHDATTAHISGVIGDAVRLPAAQPNDNSQCATCHNVAGKTIVAFRNMSTHFTTKGGAQNMLCKLCHNPHGSSNLSMIRSQMKGAWTNATSYTITYTDATNGFINTVNNRGLCQVCHSKTNHYRAGVPETGHYTSGCLACHGHNAAGGAFKATGGCDSCHGYPPLPKGLAGLTFGTAGNFANGRFEDYSGGGGAHFVPGHVKATAVASQGWANCAVCHNGGVTTSTPNHKMLTPVKSNIANVSVVMDQKYRFTAGVMSTYTGAKLTTVNNKSGSCTNIQCHFQPSRRWSSQR